MNKEYPGKHMTIVIVSVALKKAIKKA